MYNNFYDREPGVVTSMISRLQWESLEQRKAKARATFMYKIVNNLVAAYRTLYTNADVYRYSFFPRTIITWNIIPPTLRQTLLSPLMILFQNCVRQSRHPTNMATVAKNRKDG